MKIVATGILVALFLVPSTDGAAQAAADGAQQQRFRSSADVVTIQASVRDHHGRSMQGLTAKDFEVLDNGQPRPILSLRADAGSPVSVAILVDTSGSMRAGPKMSMARQAADSMVAQLRQGQDEVAIFTFDSSLRQELPFTTELDRVKGTLDGIDAFGSTALFDATAATARTLAQRAGTHKAIIVPKSPGSPRRSTCRSTSSPPSPTWTSAR
jgi:VWFA-related protein